MKPFKGVGLLYKKVNKNRLFNLMLVICIVLVSVIYSKGEGLRIVNIFLNNESEIPIYCVEIDEKKIALTFDVAIGDEFIEDILNILEKNNVKATFFVIGSWVDRHEAILKKIDSEGHEIGNHSTTHPHFTQLSSQRIKEEIYITNNKIRKITGKDVIIFRPPFGDYNREVVKTVREAGYYCIQWDVDSLDWKNPSEEYMYKRVMEKTKNGSILLFHNTAKQTPRILEKIIKDLKGKGFEFVKITELIYKEGYYIDHTGKQKPLKFE